MLSNKRGTTSGYRAVGDVPAHTLVTSAATQGEAKKAMTGSPVLGVSTEADAKDGKVFDVTFTGICPVIYGGNIAAGDPLTSNASGHAIKAEGEALVWGMAVLDGTDDSYGSINLDIKPAAAPTA